MTKFINNFYIIPIITYTIYSIYYYFFKKYKSFRGIDSSMITTNDKKYTNIFYTTFTYDFENEKFINYFKNKLLNNLNNYTLFRYNINPFDNSQYFYNNTKSEDYINDILFITNDPPKFEEIINIMIKKNLSVVFIICKNNKELYYGNNHIIIDGINSIKNFQYLCDNLLLKKNLIPNFYYFPIITELMICNKIPFLLNNICESQLQFCEDWTLFDNIYNDSYKTSINYIKNIKHKIEDIVKNKVKFTYIIFSLIITKFFNSLIKKNKLSVGIIVAFNNNYSFNNYSVINFYVNKHENWNNLDFYTKIIYILNQIDDYINKYGKQQAIFNYLISNIYGIKSNKKSIDLLIGNLPTHYDVKMNNEYITLNKFYLPLISFPIYSTCFTSNDKFLLFNTIRTKDIDINTFNNDNIFNETKKNV
jgi:hypothetical protein